MDILDGNGPVLQRKVLLEALFGVSLKADILQYRVFLLKGNNWGCGGVVVSEQVVEMGQELWIDEIDTGGLWIQRLEDLEEGFEVLSFGFLLDILLLLHLVGLLNIGSLLLF